MAILIDADNLPIQPAPDDFPLSTIAEALDTDGASVDGADIIGSQSSYGLVITKPLNANAARLDIISLASVGGYCVDRGLEPSVPGGGGLDLPISAGRAFVGTIVEISEDTEVAVPDNTAIVYIWLGRNRTLTPLSTTTPPDDAAVLIATCETSGGDIISVSTSGVYFTRGGMLYRKTDDVGAPIDTPPAIPFFWAETSTGSYLWNGTTYIPLGTAANRQQIPGFNKSTVAASLTASALVNAGFASFVAAVGGSLVGISVKTDDPRTAGTLTVVAYVAGAPVALSVVLDGTNATFNSELIADGLVTFDAGDTIDLRVTTDAGWLPTTANITATLIIASNSV